MSTTKLCFVCLCFLVVVAFNVLFLRSISMYIYMILYM